MEHGPDRDNADRRNFYAGPKRIIQLLLFKSFGWKILYILI